MSKVEIYRRQLRGVREWEPFLLRESGLPGPRGNLELAQAAAREDEGGVLEGFLDYDLHRAPEGSPQVFLVFCAVLSLGTRLAEGEGEVLGRLRPFASDPRWRVREAVAMALQTLGDRDMDVLLNAVRPWARGNPFEQRAVAAALCEPRLLTRPRHAKAVLQILDQITTTLTRPSREEGYLVLRQGLAYCWSVAVAALPPEGKARMEKWISKGQPDVVWVMRQNLRKQRLVRIEPKWVDQMLRGVTPTNPSGRSASKQEARPRKPEGPRRGRAKRNGPSRTARRVS